MGSGFPLTRRDLLRIGGSVVASSGLAGLAAGGESDRVRINVGYSTSSGRRTTLTAADEVVHEFDFDALTVLTTPDAARRLAASSGVEYVESDPTVEAIGMREIIRGLTGECVSGMGLIDGGPTDDCLTGGGLPNSGSTAADPPTGSSPPSADSDTSTTAAATPIGGLLNQVVPWGIDRVDADIAHRNGATGKNAAIAIIDTGIDYTHLDLLGNVGLGATTLGAVATDTAVPAGGQDDNGHGTHLAGTAAAVDNNRGVVGIAPRATLHPVKALLATGVGFASDVAKAIDYTAQQGWDVANLSLGGPRSEVLATAVKEHKNQVVLVAAAGNDGGAVTFPAAHEGVIAVSATTRQDELASFSSRGSETLAAPGQAIVSSYLGNTYLSLSGTSMAAAHVSGAAGQLIGERGMAVPAVRRRLKNTAEDIGLSSGVGLLDVPAALG